MGKSCVLIAHVRNSKEEVVESKLFKDLLSYTSSRPLTKEWYYVGTNPDFLKQVKDKATFDENGEITLQSLRDIAGLDINEENFLKVLNKEYNEGIYEYSEALAKVQTFNSSHRFKDKYMATLILQPNGKYKTTIIKKDTASIQALQQTIKNQTLTDSLVSRLKTLGVAVDFIENPKNKFEGRYSTKNAVKTAEGLMHLISISQGQNQGMVLAEEAGHFAVGALGNSPLVQRLTNAISPELAKSITEGKYVTDEEAVREAAGTLVGQALINKLEKKSFVSNLAYRVAQLAKRIFYNITGNEIQQDLIRAEKAAESITENFLSDEFDGTLEQALAFKETLYNAPLPAVSKKYLETVNNLRNLVGNMKTLNKAKYESYKSMLYTLESTRTQTVTSLSGPLSENIAFEGVCEALEQIADLCNHDIRTTIEGLSKDKGEADFWENAQSRASSLLELNAFCNYANAVLQTFSSLMEGQDSNHFASLPDGAQQTLIKLKKDATAVISATTHTMRVLEQQFYIKYLENQLGSKYIYTSARKLFGKEKNSKELNDIIRANKEKINHLFTSEVTQEQIAQAVEELDQDLDVVEAFIFSVSNANDVTIQIADSMTKFAHKNADDKTWEIQDRMRVLREKFNKLGIRVTDLWEMTTDENGNPIPTGNFLTPYNWGQYEKDRNEYREECFREFEAKYPNYKKMPSCVKEYMWGEFYKKKMEIFNNGDATHPAHSMKDPVTGMYVPFIPNPFVSNQPKLYIDYTNHQYNKLNSEKPEAIKWLQEYMNVMKGPEQAAQYHKPYYRIPQFKASFVNKIQNKLENKQSFLQSVGTSIGENLRETFCVDSEDYDYGSMQTYNTLKEDQFHDMFAAENEYVNRIPLYGINKLKDMTYLSTDIFHSAVAYASMAYDYQALSAVAPVLEVGRNTLYNTRKVEGKTEGRGGKQKGAISLAYKRYSKFIERQVYGIGISPQGTTFRQFKDVVATIFGRLPDVNDTSETKSKKNPIMVRKVASGLSRFGSLLFLGGNVAGGMVNLMTGNNELLKEALSGEHYNLKDWALANKLYFTHIIPIAINEAAESVNIKTVNDEPLQMLLRRWNISGDSKALEKEWSTRADKALGLFGEALYLPYKSGEHYMQSISYLALATSMKLYDANGNEISLLDSYKTVKIATDSEQRTVAMTHNAEEYTVLKEIVEKLAPYYKNALSTNANKPKMSVSLDMFSQEAQKYIADKGISFNDIITTYDDLKSDLVINTKFYKSKDGQQQENFLFNLIQHIDDNVPLTAEETKYLTDHNLEIGTETKKNDTIHALNNAIDDLSFNSADESKFMDKAREINNRLHGIYNNQDKTLFHQNLYGNMLLAMRGYALGMIERRFGKNKWNQSLGHYTEGSKITMYKLWLSFLKDMSMTNFWKSMALTFCPFTARTKQYAQELGFDDNQYANMRRNWGDNFLIGLYTLIKYLTAKTGGDDDDDDDQVDGIIYYFATRLLREQSAFNTIQGFWEEKNSIFSLEPTGVSALGTMVKMIVLGVGALAVDEDSDMYSEFYYKRSGKDHEAGDSKFKVHLLRMLPFYRSKRVIDDGYEAAKSYEFGRRVR